ncbi:unnamed protein product [Hyaloperonospora brassicae]|uniref:TATA element modulatory factor 1 TATA binding domain-containing protein n=1 Tax=Hyaloperonospora brassicae TaxID=162125 RepID=A0AAV0TVV0_HYABA|nr:unnamed protein product [Hyaloperonospora brassicae]
MASSSPWGAWSSKLNVTSIVSQGIEQVRSLREDVEKSFDHVVTGVPGTRSLSTAATTAQQIGDAQVGKNKAIRSTNQAVAVFDTVVDTSMDTAAPVAAETLLEQWDSIDTVEEKERADQVETKGQRRDTRDDTEQTDYKGDVPDEQQVKLHVREGLAPGATAEAADEEERGVDREEEKKEEQKAEEEEGEEAETREEQKAEKEVQEQEEEEQEQEQDKKQKKKKKKQKKKRRKKEAGALVQNEKASAGVGEDREGGAEQEQDGALVAVVDNENEKSSDGYGEGHAEEGGGEGEAVPDEALVAVVENKEEIVVDLQHQMELEARESQLLTASTTIQNLHNELDETRHREIVALERVQSLTEQLENMQREVAKLTKSHNDASSSSGQRGDVQALQLALAEKEEKLSALLDEGQALSVKQAQLEQRLRSLRKEKDELEERARRAESRAEASAKEVQELMSKLKASEKEKTHLAQQNSHLASDADTASARVEQAEHNALEATQQLESLQAQLKELTRSVVSKDEEIARLATASRSSKSLSLEKAELEQTLQFLQENVRALEEEGTRREVRARAEITDLKHKWQDAMARVDMLGQSVSEATQPLLRQIHALQEDQRARQESWRAMEITFVARIDEAIEQRRVAMQERVNMEQRLHEVQQKVEEVELGLIRKQAELARAQDSAAIAKAEARELHKQVDALQMDLDQARHQCDAETEVKEQLQTRLLVAEQSIKTARASSTATVELEQSREREAELRHDLDWHRQELQRLKTAVMQTAAIPLSTGSTSSQHQTVRRSRDDEQSCRSEDADGELSSEASILKMALETDSLTLNGGNTSVLGLSQLQQRLRLREGENRLLKQQLETLEARQKQTADEIVRLSSRNALLESGEAQLEQAQLELAKLQKHQVVLLELFGEKEEQVEELQAEVKELKAFYRKQLDTLATHSEQQQKQQAEQRHC